MAQTTRHHRIPLRKKALPNPKMMLKIPKGTASGALLRMRGQGIKTAGGRSKGDQIVRTNVSVPPKITKRQEELLKEFAEIEQEQGGKKSIWEKLFG